MVAAFLAAVIAICGHGTTEKEKGWASWYASPLASSSNYNNPWYTRGKNKTLNFAAVKSFRWGDTPYSIHLCAVKTGKCVIARVVDHCSGCTGKRLVDLSPILFTALGIPLHHGVAKVFLRRLDGNQRSSYCSPTAR